MPGPYFVSDKCQEDKCLDPLLVRTNARRTNARTHIIFGQMPGGQMPEPTFGPDKCQEDKCLNPQVQAFVHRGICPLLAFVLRGICPTGGQMPVQAFVLPGICLSRHLSANPYSTLPSGLKPRNKSDHLPFLFCFILRPLSTVSSLSCHHPPPAATNHKLPAASTHLTLQPTLHRTRVSKSG